MEPQKTKHSEAVTPATPKQDGAKRRQIVEALSRAAKAKAVEGPGAASSQDFLYDEDGLPE